jgi:hypothetical protein
MHTLPPTAHVPPYIVLHRTGVGGAHGRDTNPDLRNRSQNVAESLPINSLLSVVTIEIVKIRTKHQVETLEHILNREIKWKGCASEHNNREEGNRRGRTYQKSGVLQSSSPDGSSVVISVVPPPLSACSASSAFSISIGCVPSQMGN